MKRRLEIKSKDFVALQPFESGRCFDYSKSRADSQMPLEKKAISKNPSGTWMNTKNRYERRNIDEKKKHRGIEQRLEQSMKAG